MRLVYSLTVNESGVGISNCISRNFDARVIYGLPMHKLCVQLKFD